MSKHFHQTISNHPLDSFLNKNSQISNITADLTPKFYLNLNRVDPEEGMIPNQRIINLLEERNFRENNRRMTATFAVKIK